MNDKLMKNKRPRVKVGEHEDGREVTRENSKEGGRDSLV